MFKVEPNLKEIALRQLTQRRARKEGEPQRPVTTVRCKALHGLQFRAMVEGHNFISDEGEEAGGTDAGPAPLRYFLAGIMMCHQVWCVKSAALADVRLDNLEGEISGYLAQGDSARKGGFERATFTVTVDSPSPSEEVKKIVARASERCASFVTFARAARIELNLMHNGQKVDERTYG